MTTPSDYVGARVREVRRSRGLSTRALAVRCAELGADLTQAAINDIETGRRRPSGERRRQVSVDELLALALALNAPPLYLVIPPDQLDELYPITPTEFEVGRNVAEWATGHGPILPRMPLAGEVRGYYAELPDEKFIRVTR